MNKYTDIFFDLDHTLWDFDKNAALTLSELYESYQLSKHGILDVAHFIQSYQTHNHRLWEEYRKGKLFQIELRTMRFEHTFKDFGLLHPHFLHDFAMDYVKICPLKTHLIDGALELLSYLKPKYRLHIITNGFEDVQHIKLSNSGIYPFFDHVITSEQANSKKPNRAIFQYALNKCHIDSSAVIMIGDSYEVDIMGAMQANIDQIYFNPERNTIDGPTPSYTVSSLTEIQQYL